MLGASAPSADETGQLIASRFHSKLPWEIIIVDDASPDGTLEVAKQLQGVYGEDHIVSTRRALTSRRVVPLADLLARQILKPRTGKLGLG